MDRLGPNLAHTLLLVLQGLSCGALGRVVFSPPWAVCGRNPLDTDWLTVAFGMQLLAQLRSLHAGHQAIQPQRIAQGALEAPGLANRERVGLHTPR